jgi:uncharacterized protein YcgI (DUF1989 family)
MDDRTTARGAAATGTLHRGQVLRITDVYGGQVADFCSWNRHDPAEHCDVIYTTLNAERWKLGEGDVLYSRDMNPMWTIVADTYGTHYSGGNFCSGPLLRTFEGNPDATRGCREALEEAIAEHGLSPLHLSVAACFNVFMHVPYREDGSMTIERTVTLPGDHIDLRAEMDILWAVSVCPGGKPHGDGDGALRFSIVDEA